MFKTMQQSTKAGIGAILIGYPGLKTVLLASVALFGVGVMPDPTNVQNSIVDLVMATLGAILIYQFPNLIPTIEEVEGIEPTVIEEQKPTE